MEREELVIVGEGFHSADHFCDDCQKKFIVCKKHIMDDFVIEKCPICESKNIRRLWCPVLSDVAKGSHGNASTGYSNEFAYKPSKFGKFRGERVKHNG